MSFWIGENENQKNMIILEKTKKRFNEEIGEIENELWEKDLAKFLKKKMQFSSWLKKVNFVQFRSTFSPYYKVNLYNSSIEAANTLYTNLVKLYLDIKKFKVNVFPQNLCFFNAKGEVIFSTSMEDKSCYLFIRNQNISDILLEIPIWEEIPYLAEEDFYIDLPIEE